MEILKIKVVHGPNVYHQHPVVYMKVDLGKWAEVASNEIPDFNKKLLAMLPGLQTHTCSPGVVGGFCERLSRGTYMAHISEHIALELSNLCGMEISFGKSRYAGKPGIYYVVTRYINEEAMKECLRGAVRLLRYVLEGEEFDLNKQLEEIRYLYESTRLGPSASAIVDAAVARGIPHCRLGEDSLIQLGYGKHRRWTQAAVTDKTSLIADEIPEVIEHLPGPYAVKPFDGHHGKGVVLNLKTKEELETAFYIAKEHSSGVIIEQFCTGKDYRVLVIDNKLIAAAERQPPFIICDGEKSISQLIEILNSDPRRSAGHMNALTKIEIDDVLIECLQKQNCTLESIPPRNQKIHLRDNANLSSGGTAKDVTDEVHPEIKIICERISRLVDLDICGIDLIHHDISQPVGDSFKIIEVNAGPGLRMHLLPTEGKARPVGDAIINMLYPPGTPCRIPIASVTGTNGKTTTVRLLAKILAQKPNCKVGLTTTDGIWIGSHKIRTGDTTGPESTKIILSDPGVDAAVLEVARGGLLRGGLSYDWSDVSVVTNIQPDHIGQDGIETLDDLVWIKSLVAERVKENGCLVLNADDEQSLNLRERKQVKRFPRKIVLYSTKADNKYLIEHLARGGEGFWQEEGWLCGYYNEQSYRFVEVSDLSFTLGGKADFQVSNALAALAAGLHMGATPQQAVEGLKAFHGSFDNPGRANLYRVRDGHVFLDYGHNTDAIAAFGRMLYQWPGYYTTAMIGLPGDRTTEILSETAKQLAVIFDKIILRDDMDLRGREPGEVPKLLKGTINLFRPQVQCDITTDESETLNRILQNISKNEVVAIFYDDLDSIMKVVRQFDPVPVEALVPIANMLQFPVKERVLHQPEATR